MAPLRYTVAILALCTFGGCAKPAPTTDASAAQPSATQEVPARTLESADASAEPVEEGPSAEPSAPAEEADASAPRGRPLSKEGEMCGGIAGRLCQPGLRCVMTGAMHPDKAGRCARVLPP